MLKLYPEFAETFCTEIVHDLTFNLREGYENENGIMHAAHSLTLPSISEDDEENDDNDNDDGDSGSPSPPSTPPMGGGILASGRHKPVIEDWEPMVPRQRRGIVSEVPLLGQMRRPVLRLSQLKSSPHSRSMAESSDLKDEVEMTRTSVDRLDSQLSHLTLDVAKLSSEVRLALTLLQSLSKAAKSSCSSSSTANANAVQSEKTHSCEEIASKSVQSACKLVVSEPLSQKCSSQSLNSSCASQLQSSSIQTSKRNVQTRSVQTERFLLDDLLCKLADAGSPPPNSGYSSSSSNEERVRYLIGMHVRGGTEDSESISDDSVLKNSLTIQSMTSSRDVSPFKGSRNSWNTPFSEPATSPLPSPRPSTVTVPVHVQGEAAPGHSCVVPTSQCAIDIDYPSTSSVLTRRKLSTEL